MGTKPGERTMRQLERRAETISGEFNSQNVANTLWAFATMGTKPGERMMGQLERRAEAISGEFNSQDIANTLCQLVFSPFILRVLGFHAALPARFLALKEKCRAVFIGSPVQPSVGQQQVSDALREMGLSVEDEFRCPKSGYSIDMRARHVHKLKQHHRGLVRVGSIRQHTSAYVSCPSGNGIG
jgi:hypothetical protein